jgi:competence protein ComEC
MDATRRWTRADGEAAATKTRYQPLVNVLLAVAAGIVVDRFGRERINLPAFATFYLSAVVMLTAWWIIWRNRAASRPRRELVAACILLASVSLTAAAWHDLRWHHFDRHEIGRFAADQAAPVCIDVVARESPSALPVPAPTALRAIPAGERSRLDVQVIAIRDGKTWRAASGNCQLTIDGRLSARAGDRLRVFGQFARAAPPRNPGEFDFAEFARSDRRLAHLTCGSPEAVSVLSPGTSFDVSRLLDALRRGGQRLIERCVGSERAALTSAILLGERQGLTREETKPYLVTGTVHLLVVSGLNVAILAMGLHVATRWGLVGRRLGLTVVIVLVAAYAAVAGAEPPVVRAAVLAVILCIAAWGGRRSFGFNALAAAALVVLAMNPADLFRAGPQLSFLAVATLIWMNEVGWRWQRNSGDRLDQLIAASRPWHQRWIRAGGRWNGWLLVTTLVVWLTALPLVLYQFHVLTPITVLISPAVWIVVLVALWSGFLMLLLGWLLPPIGSLLGAVCDESLSALENIVRWGESMPGGHFWAPGPAWWWVVIFYVGLVAVMLWGSSLGPRRWRVAALGVLVVIGFVPAVFRAAARDRLEVAFVSVGHGTCVVLQAPSGETLIYDAGALGSPDTAARTVASYLWHRGILRIDGIVLSHADVDHYNAVPGILKQFNVGAIYVSPAMFDGITSPFDDRSSDNDSDFLNAELRRGESANRTLNPPDGPTELRVAIDRAGVPIREIWAGDRLRLGADVTLDVLHPPRRGVIGSDNANSITLVVEHSGRRVLLPGDLESPGLDDLMAELPRDCDILLAPHHGSRRSDPPGFAAWSTPEWVVVSCGNVDVRPAVRSYELAGATAFQTNLHGTIEFAIDREAIRAETWQRPN